MDHHQEAKFIVEKLNTAGYIAYYAGGWVRDYLLKHPSDDIDIATSCPPEKVMELFEHTVPVGIAFGIVVVIMNDKKYEVATFRKDFDYLDGRRPTSVEYTTPFQDALRRDFTINGMFYDPMTDEIHDFVEGKKDLAKKIIKAIGNPEERFFEDRLRMIRAIRLSTRFDFKIEDETRKAIYQNAKNLFPSVAIERIYQEFSKMDQFHCLKESLLKLFDFHLLQVIFPKLKKVKREYFLKLIKNVESFPKKVPLFLKLLEMFPKFAEKEIENLSKYLKISKKDFLYAKHLYYTKQIVLKFSNFEKSTDLFTLAYLFANPHTDKCLEIIKLHLNDAKLFEKLKDLKISLEKPIKRIVKKKPVIASKDLIDLGIKPGVQMGDILKEAEKISINEKIDKKDKIIEKLKKLDIWMV